jgi:hypothetical protein
MNWMDVFELNPRPTVTVERVGSEKHRVVIVDDFYRYPERVAELARSLSYVGAAGNGNFPGVRAVISIDTRFLIAALSELWGSRLEGFEAFHPVLFSALQGGIPLNVGQRQPHVDPGVTALIYLNLNEHCAGGTGLYRHRLTGLERIPLEATPEIARLAAQCAINPESLKTPGGYTSFQDSIVFNPLFAVRGNSYVNDGNDFWELLYLIAMKYNRLVAFDGRQFHSQYLKESDFRDHPRINQLLYLRPA